MSNKPPSGQPPQGPLGGDDPELTSEQQLDDFLAQAYSLAEEISTEVGAADPPEPTSRPAEVGLGDADLSRHVEAGLSELQSLMATTRHELDALNERHARPDPAGNRPATPTCGPPDAASNRVDASQGPGRTGAKSRQDAPHAAGATAETQQVPPIRPGVVGTGMIGLIGTRPTMSETRTRQSGSSAADNGEPGSAATPEATGWSSRLKHAAGWRVSLIVAEVGDWTVWLMERIDIPFAALGTAAKRAIGWLAIATVATSILVYFYSLF